MNGRAVVVDPSAVSTNMLNSVYDDALPEHHPPEHNPYVTAPMMEDSLQFGSVSSIKELLAGTSIGGSIGGSFVGPGQEHLLVSPEQTWSPEHAVNGNRAPSIGKVAGVVVPNKKQELPPLERGYSGRRRPAEESQIGAYVRAKAAEEHVRLTTPFRTHRGQEGDGRGRRGSGAGEGLGATEPEPSASRGGGGSLASASHAPLSGVGAAKAGGGGGGEDGGGVDRSRDASPSKRSRGGLFAPTLSSQRRQQATTDRRGESRDALRSNASTPNSRASSTTPAFGSRGSTAASPTRRRREPEPSRHGSGSAAVDNDEFGSSGEAEDALKQRWEAELAEELELRKQEKRKILAEHKAEYQRLARAAISATARK